MCLQFFAQLADVAIHCTLLGIPLRQAVSQQFGAAERPFRRPHQRGEQLELGQCQLQHLLLVIAENAGLVALQIDLKLADPQHIRRGRLYGSGAPEHGLHSRHHFGRIEGFDHIVIRPHAQPHQLVEILIEGGQHDHRRVATRPDLAEHLPAIQLRHLHIQQQEIGFECLMHGQRFTAIGGVQGAQAMTLQVSGEDVGDLGFILCNQYQ